MGRVRTMQILSLCVVLLLAIYPMGISAEQEVNLSIENDFEAEEWYISGDSISFNSWLMNSGDSITFDDDPTCGIIVNIYDSESNLIQNGEEICRGQNRGQTLDSGEIGDLYSASWNFQINEELVESGIYTIESLHTGTSLSKSFDVQFFAPVEWPESLNLEVEVISSSADFSEYDADIARLTWTNYDENSVSMPDDQFCRLIISVSEEERVGPSCFDEIGLEGWETRLHHAIDLGFDIETRSEMIISTPNGEWSETFSLLPKSVTEGMTSNLNGLSPEQILTSDSTFAPSILLENNLDSDIELEFTNSCRAVYWIYDAIGNLVFDSQQLSGCNEMIQERVVPKQGGINLQMPNWFFTDVNGCSVGTGEYIIVASIPEIGISKSQTFEFERNFAEPCGEESLLSLEADLSGTENGFDMDITLSSQSDSYLTWQGPCALELTLKNLENQKLQVRQTVCDTYDGRSFSLSDGAEFSLKTDEIIMLNSEGNPLEDGTYIIEVKLATRSINEHIIEFNWPLDEQVEQETAAPEQAGNDEIELIGTWTGFLTEQGTCWVLTQEDETQFGLNSALGITDWSPLQGQSGIFKGSLTSDTSLACSNYQIQNFDITEVVYIYESVEEIQPIEEKVTEETVEIQEQIVPVNNAIPVISVIASTTLLSLLVTAIISNESLRIPSTAMGLWLIGLVGKTSETTDGKYQRGRIMGYLTANPGCHFRALMAAMQMSNGQCTHHIRILEKEEKIWRKKDGRLVRYYPLTSDMNPYTEEQELPVPPLSPDPKSLQGKILTILDDDGLMGEFPTQAVLAKRLDKSQQLISHHLRTLQKYGLVERRKMGMKNCYKLTREAIFLLETDEKFGR
ncbi:MAG: hypothetical protein ACPGAN_01265 [Candidatus Poseidoniaceae archaeon]